MSFNPKLDEFLSHLKQLTKNNNGWEACCPAHEDSRPSLSIHVNGDGKILLKCQSNDCHPANIMQCAGMSASDLFPPRESSGRAEWGSLAATYEYLDEQGVLLFQVCRFEKIDRGPDGTEKKTKTFRQRHKKAGEWVWKMAGVRRVLYRLPQILSADAEQPIWLCEGEKQCDYLVSLGLNATCNPQGAGKWQDDFSDSLRGRDVILVPDNDPVTEKKGEVHCVGMEHAEAVADSLTGKVKSVHVLLLPGAEEKWGLDDWLQKGGHELEELEELLAAANQWVYGSKLFDRTPATAPPPDDPYAFHKECAAAIGLDVLGELDNGGVALYSRFHKKTAIFKGVSGWKLPDVLQIAGPPSGAAIYVGKDSVPDGQYTMNDVRNSVAILAGRRRIEETLHGAGVWRCDKDLVLVSRGELVQVNGKLERIESAEVSGHVYDLNDLNKPWFEFNDLSRCWAASENRDWCRGVVERAETLFGQWSFTHNDSNTLITGLIMATWIQSVWNWRPQIFILGESNTGKTTLFHVLGGAEHMGAKGIFGSLCLKFANYTSAGIQQGIGRSAKIVICDEFEQSKARDEVLTMVRASGRGDPIVRGTTSHRSRSFRLHQMFWMASTESGLKREVDQNRFIKIELTKPLDDQKRRSFKLPPNQEIESLGLELLTCILRHTERAVSLATYLYRSRPPGLHDRICESYAVPAATVAAVTGMTDEEAFALYIRLLKMSDQESIEQDRAQIIDDILNGQVDCGRGVRRTAGEIVSSCLPGGGYIGSEVESALSSHGVMVCREDSRDEVSAWGVFLYPKLVTRTLLRDTDWAKVRIGEHLIRFKGAIKTKKTINGSRPWGFWVPISSIDILSTSEEST